MLPRRSSTAAGSDGSLHSRPSGSVRGRSRSAPCCRSPPRRITAIGRRRSIRRVARARAQRDDALRLEIQRVYDEQHQVYGPRKVGKQLRREGCRHYRPCWTPYVAHEGGRWCPRPSTISGGRGRYSTTPLSTVTSGRPAVTSASPAPCFTSGGARIRVRETPGSSTSARALGLTPMRPRLRWSN